METDTVLYHRKDVWTGGVNAPLPPLYFLSAHDCRDMGRGYATCIAAPYMRHCSG